jgi:nitronate monooxygenase
MMTPRERIAGLTLPVLAAPMFLVSGPDLVIACCRSGIIGSFPTLNIRSSAEFGEWLDRIEGELARDPGAYGGLYGVNLVVHSSNTRLEADLGLIEKHRVPLVITSAGSPREIARIVHGYGGMIFHDVTTIDFAKRAIAAGVDGVILICAGAGGHTGHYNPFAFVAQVRQFYDGIIILAGGIADGRSIRAAEILGADLVYMGTRFIPAAESMAADAYKEMLVTSQVSDLIGTRAFSGITASMLKPSIVANGLDPDNLADKERIDFMADFNHETRAWRDIWSAGQGVGSIDEVEPLARIVAKLRAEYHAALGELDAKVWRI